MNLLNIVDDACSILDHPVARVLDVGCNDGTLLSYYPDQFEKYGVDPSDVAQETNGDATVVQDIFPSNELKNPLKEKQMDIITSLSRRRPQNRSAHG